MTSITEAILTLTGLPGHWATYVEGTNMDGQTESPARAHLKQRALYEIAAEVRATWPNVNYAAEPYLAAMATLGSMHDQYYDDTAKSVVIYFLSNARSWRGADAKRIKAELKGMI